MGCIQQKQSRVIILIVVIFSTVLLLYPQNLKGDIISYDPEVDISLGTFSYLTSSESNISYIKTGPYFGGYLSMKSPIFTYFFNSQNIYNIFELGFSVNELVSENQSFYIVSIPFSVDFAYKIQLFPKFSIYPLVGVGFSTTLGGNYENQVPIYPFIKTGIEIKFLIWKDTNLKIKVDYGIAFVDIIETGFLQFIKVRFPIPFIP